MGLEPTGSETIAAKRAARRAAAARWHRVVIPAPPHFGVRPEGPLGTIPVPAATATALACY